MNDAVVIALIAVVPSLITAITAVITTVIANGNKRKKEADERISKANKEICERIDEVDNTLKEYIASNNQSMKVLLRHDIDQMYERFMARGYITYKEQEEVEETFQEYSSKGGNHIGEEKYKAIISLPKRNN